MDIRQESFRYDMTGKWYKGNTHIHTPASDGGTDVVLITEMYLRAGYDFLFGMDHWVCSDCGEQARASPLLWLRGMELDGPDDHGAYYHVVCIGKVEGITREMGFLPALEAARKQKALLVLAHPYWTGNSLEDAVRWNFDGVEIYNNVSRWLNGKCESGAHWGAMLKQNPDTLAFCADDAHLRREYPGWNGGWIVVNARERTQPAIMRAIRNGNYYSSCGPDFRAIKFEGDAVHIGTSPVRFARLVGPGYLGKTTDVFEGGQITEISFQIPAEWDYAYLEIEDHTGKRAWTNTLFTTHHPTERAGRCQSAHSHCAE